MEKGKTYSDAAHETIEQWNNGHIFFIEIKASKQLKV